MRNPDSTLGRILGNDPAPVIVAALLGVIITLQLLLFVRDARSGYGVPSASAPSTAAGLSLQPMAVDLSLVGRLFGVAERSPVDSASSLVLTGTFVWGEAGSGIAILGPTGEQSSVYHVGAELPGGLMLAQVHADRIVVSRGGLLEILRFPPLAPGEANLAQEPALQVAQQSQPNDILSGFARVIPVRSGAKFNGYRVYPNEDANAFREIGLRSGDVIVAINGTRLDDPKIASGLVGTLSWATGMAVTVRRGGRESDLVLNTARAAENAAQSRQLHELASSAQDPVTRPYKRRGAATAPAVADF